MKPGDEISKWAAAVIILGASLHFVGLYGAAIVIGGTVLVLELVDRHYKKKVAELKR